jgi:hypothetical protein
LRPDFRAIEAPVPDGRDRDNRGVVAGAKE